MSWAPYMQATRGSQDPASFGVKYPGALGQRPNSAAAGGGCKTSCTPTGVPLCNTPDSRPAKFKTTKCSRRAVGLAPGKQTAQGLFHQAPGTRTVVGIKRNGTAHFHRGNPDPRGQRTIDQPFAKAA